ncbi:MAG: EamA family transporter [Williamsia herbipolensis]|nr:EamA family transporter [Williamsia herbipolensis]
MDPATIALVLVAAVTHAVWNTASKWKRGDTVRFVWAYTVGSTVLCLPVALVHGAVTGGAVSPALLLGVVVSGVLHVAYSLTLQTGYDHADLGVVYPVARGTGPVITTLVAVCVLGERLSTIETVGVVLVVLGVVIVLGNPFRAAARSVEPWTNTGSPTPAGRGSAAVHGPASSSRAPIRGVLWGATTGVTIAAYTLWDDHSVTALHLDPIGYFAGTLLVETVVLAPRALRGGWRPVLDIVRANPIVVPLIAVLSPVAYVLVLIAMQTAPVAIVAPLRESSIVLGSLLGWWLFHERSLPRRLAGAVVVLAGIVAVGMSG